MKAHRGGGVRNAAPIARGRGRKKQTRERSTVGESPIFFSLLSPIAMVLRAIRARQTHCGGGGRRGGRGRGRGGGGDDLGCRLGHFGDGGNDLCRGPKRDCAFGPPLSHPLLAPSPTRRGPSTTLPASLPPLSLLRTPSVPRSWKAGPQASPKAVSCRPSRHLRPLPSPPHPLFSRSC